jgi:DNA-binding NarL/FixJ family response regulator
MAELADAVRDLMLTRPKIRVIVVDDHALVRDGLRHLVDCQPDMAVVAEAADGSQAMTAIDGLVPDVVLMDVLIPGSSGVSLTLRISRQHPAVRVIGVSRHNERSVVRGMMQAGARGYVCKQNASSELPAAIRAVAKGQEYLDTTIRPVAAAPQGDEGSDRDVEVMTPEEEQVLRLVALSNTHGQIAKRLSITMSETMRLKSVAMQKNHLASRAHLLAYARTRGWLSRQSDASAPAAAAQPRKDRNPKPR